MHTMSTGEFLTALLLLIVVAVVVLVAVLDHISMRRWWRQQRDIEQSLQADRRRRMQRGKQ